MTQQALGEQIIALTDTMYRVSRGLLAQESDREDAVQTAIEKALKKAHRLRDEGKVKPWLIRILVNECYNLLKKKAREYPMDLLPEPVPPADRAAELREAVLLLPPDVRMPIMLHYMEGFSTKEIADALGCPQGTILSRLNRGRKQLKLLLTEAEET